MAIHRSFLAPRARGHAEAEWACVYGRVAVVERGPLRGRSQEWNISRKELAELVRARLACLS